MSEIDFVATWARIKRRSDGVEGPIADIVAAAGKAADAEVAGTEMASRGPRSELVWATEAVRGFMKGCGAAGIPDYDIDYYVSPKCQAMFCHLDEHDGNEHVDYTGTSFIRHESGRNEITHTNFDPWTD
ncbi:hypothetical protein [Nocardia sp. NPDC051570]|uniref:hypothetical protein n=1 Tax=Nocardia sp. NPDC051570 TaxID=3364324 RepID=UPI0037AABCBC